jgi:hypothetical protein
MVAHLSAASIATRSSGDIAPVRRRRKRIDGRFKPARRVKALAASYVERLGDVASDPIVQRDIVQLAETETLIEELRAAALRREPVDLLALNRLQGTARRMRIGLGLNAPLEPELPTIDEMLAEIDE